MPKRVLSQRYSIHQRKKRARLKSATGQQLASEKVTTQLITIRTKKCRRKRKIVKEAASLKNVTVPELVTHIMEKCRDDENAQQQLLHEVLNKALVDAKQKHRGKDKSEQNSDNQEVQSTKTKEKHNESQVLTRSQAKAADQKERNICSDIQEDEPDEIINHLNNGNTSHETNTTHAIEKSKNQTVEVDQNRLAGVHFHDHKSLMEVGEGIIYTMRQREQFNRPDENHLNRQKHISKRMRATLIDWMFEVGQEFVLKRETLHVSITFVDRYLSKIRDVPKRELQLIGVAALWLASKAKEIYPPKAQDLTFATDGAYSVKQLIKMEQDMLSVLDYALDPITCYAWAVWYMHELFSYSKKSCKRRLKGFQRKLVRESDGPAMNAPLGNNENICSLNSPNSKLKKRKTRITRCFSSNRNSPNMDASCRWIDTPNIPKKLFIRLMEIIDTALLDIDSLCFLPSTVAASALLHVLTNQTSFASVESIEQVTMYNENELFSCLEWMGFSFDLPDNPEFHPREDFIRKHIPESDSYSIQTHNKGSLRLFRTTAGNWDERHPACNVQHTDWSQVTIASATAQDPSLLSVIPPTPDTEKSSESVKETPPSLPAGSLESNKVPVPTMVDDTIVELAANESL